MITDEIKELLESMHPDVEAIKTFWNNSNITAEEKRLSEITTDESFWKNPNQATILKQLQRVRRLLERFKKTVALYEELANLAPLLDNPNDQIQLAAELTALKTEIQSFKIDLLLNDENDINNCFLDINAGAGGTESQDWAEILLRMYLRFCERNNLKAKVVAYQTGETAGIKSATIMITGDYAYGLLKGEHGIHRLVRISPFDANKRRHTSFAGVMVTPEAPEVAEITIDQNDLRVDTYRASGAGGQHVNKTESAVRITHIPTGIVVQCQNERSQMQNRATALAMLKAKLLQKATQEREEQLSSSLEKKRIEWGSQIRSYILHPYKMVKDHRTSVESPQPDVVLDGDLMSFIETYLLMEAKTAKNLSLH